MKESTPSAAGPSATAPAASALAAIPHELIGIWGALSVAASDASLARAADDSIRFLDPSLQDQYGTTFAAIRSLNGTGPGVALRDSLAAAGLPNDQIAEILLAVEAIVPSRDALPNAETAARTRRHWTHRDLLGMQFPAQRWVVEELVPDEGLTVLGAKKKVGKSFMALQLCQSVAGGTAFLDKAAQQGDVVYLALEDGPRRLQSRLRLQRSAPDLPIDYITTFAPLNSGGLEALEELLIAREPILVVIDTLAAAKTGAMDENSAGDMGDLANDLREMGQRHGTAIVIVAHHGKGKYGDPGDDIRGSSAIAAASDANLGLYKAEEDYHTLKVEGRDIAEQELRVQFDRDETWKWQLLGDEYELAASEGDQRILDILHDDEHLTVQQIAEVLDRDRTTIQRRLNDLYERGRIERDKKGHAFTYAIPTRTGA